MENTLQNEIDPMCPDPNWDERYEAIIVHTAWKLSEFLHATRLGGDLYRIEKQPLNTPGLCYGDIVRALKKECGLPELVDTVEPSGYEAHLIEGLERDQTGRSILAELNILGMCEPLASGAFSMAARPENWPAIRKLLDENGIKISKFWWESVEDFKEYDYDDSRL